MLTKRKAYWTYDADVNAYYFAPTQRRNPPYLNQRHVTAIIDIADDGSLAGVELVLDDLPMPPV